MAISTDRAGRQRQLIRVQLPCDSCTHSGLCLIQEALEQDLTLVIGVPDPHSGMVAGGPSLDAAIRIDCSEWDPRAARPRGLKPRKRPPKPKRNYSPQALASLRANLAKARAAKAARHSRPHRELSAKRA